MLVVHNQAEFTKKAWVELLFLVIKERTGCRLQKSHRNWRRTNLTMFSEGKDQKRFGF